MTDKPKPKLSYRLLQPLIQDGVQKTPTEHPTVELRADQAERLAAQGVVAPKPAPAGKQEG